MARGVPLQTRWVERESGTQGRHHLDPRVVEKAVKRAVVEAGVTKAASCHTFAMPSPPISWNAARTSARSGNCWAIRMSAPP